LRGAGTGFGSGFVSSTTLTYGVWIFCGKGFGTGLTSGVVSVMNEAGLSFCGTGFRTGLTSSSLDDDFLRIQLAPYVFYIGAGLGLAGSLY